MSEAQMESDFMQAFDEYGDAIFRFCVVKVSDTALAEDMTQETFMRYWQALRRKQEMSNTRSFLYTIANNLAKDWYKKKKSVSLDWHMETGFEPAVESEVELDAEYRMVLRLIEDMEEGDRTTLLLRHVEGLEPKDIAAIMGENANTVSIRLTRAMNKLRQKINHG